MTLSAMLIACSYACTYRSIIVVTSVYVQSSTKSIQYWKIEHIWMHTTTTMDVCIYIYIYIYIYTHIYIHTYMYI